LGITDATIRWLREVGEPKNTRQIADELKRRGIQTRSKNWIATVYATLANAKEFMRKDDKWELQTDNEK
jgi:hypothetical protein